MKYFKYTHLLHGQRQQCWQTWNCRDGTCKVRSCRAKPPRRTASDPWQQTPRVHAQDLLLMSFRVVSTYRRWQMKCAWTDIPQYISMCYHSVLVTSGIKLSLGTIIISIHEFVLWSNEINLRHCSHPVAEWLGLVIFLTGKMWKSKQQRYLKTWSLISLQYSKSDSTNDGRKRWIHLAPAGQLTLHGPRYMSDLLPARTCRQ